MSRAERQMTFFPRITACVTLLALGTIPVAAADREHQQIVADVRMLQEQAQQLALALVSLSDALKTVSADIEKQSDTARTIFADQKLLMDNMGADLRVIRERSDETNVRISSLDQEIEALRTAIAEIPVAPSVSSIGLMPYDPFAPVGAAAPVSATLGVTPSIAGLSPRRMYDQAFADYGAGQYSLAVQGWEAFLRTFPASDLAPEAQFFVGESFQSAQKYAEAISAYNQVIKRYPNSNSAPDAYYKRGMAEEKMGDIDAARESWQTAVNGYPDSDAGRMAKQGLDRLTAREP